MSFSGYSKVDRIIPHAAVSADLFLVKMMGTWNLELHEVQLIDILSHFIFPLTLNQCLPSFLQREIVQPLSVLSMKG